MMNLVPVTIRYSYCWLHHPDPGKDQIRALGLRR